MTAESQVTWRRVIIINGHKDKQLEADRSLQAPFGTKKLSLLKSKTGLERIYKNRCAEIGLDTEIRQTVSSPSTKMDGWTVVQAVFILAVAQVDSGQGEQLN
jgi:hypothetical protein